MATKKKAKKKVAAKKKTAPKKAAPAVRKGPRQTSLPGMEDRAVSALDDAALSYDEVKKARMKLTVKEVEAKDLVAQLMHKANKTHYKHGNILIDLVPEGEKVKVKVDAEESDGDDTAGPSGDTSGEAAEDEVDEESDTPEDEGEFEEESEDEEVEA